MNLLVFSLLVLSLYVAGTFGNPDSTPECPEGEEYVECRNCGKSCQNLVDRLFIKCGCNPGCDCSKGFRNSKGICVPLEQCECPFNEIFTRCDKNDCQATCKKPYRLENQECPCRAGCVCNEGYLRNDARECVLPIQCECPENELYMDCHGCEDTCRNPHLSSSSTCPCYLKCYCLSGFLRNDEGKCVRQKECSKVSTTKSVNVTTKTPTHTPTKAPTKAQTTVRASSPTKSPTSPKKKQLYNSTRAPTVTTTKTTTNSPTTQYRPEFPNKACLYLPNGTYTECDANPSCQKTCRNPFSDADCECVEGCTCKEGYLLQSLENCVLAEDCEPIDCKQNEMYSKCDNHGCQNNCADPNISERCRYKAGCYPGCICIPGYLRNEDGNCVLAETCVNRCPNANEKYSLCGTACPRTCSNKDELALKCTKNCVQGCFCLEGYVRDDSGVCILPENCPAPVCGSNQVYDKCPPTIPAESTCVNVFKATSPEHPNPCKPGCKCKTGFLRIGKECLIEGKCCTDPNAELVKNPPCCGGGTCAKPEWITGCGKKSDPKGCQCKKGYCKKSETDATCIAVKDCKKQVPLPYDK